MNRAKHLPFSFLAAAALTLALAAPAHAQVSVDYQQLDGTGMPAAAPAYGDVRPVRSPLTPADVSDAVAALPLESVSAAPDVITGAKPITLKPLAKWKMPTPDKPISLGMRAPIFLSPPGVNTRHMIAELAQKSPAKTLAAAAEPLHLRPPAPIPPMPQQLAGAAPPLRTLISPPVYTAVKAPVPQTQIALASIPPMGAPAPATEITLTAAAPPQPLTAITSPPPVAPMPAALPVSPQGDLRAEDVVALDLGAPQHENSPAPTSPDIAPPPHPPAPEKHADNSPPPVVPPPLPAELSKIASVRAAKPEFISPLTEELPADDSDTTPSAPQRSAAPEPAFTVEKENFAPGEMPAVALSDDEPTPGMPIPQTPPPVSQVAAAAPAPVAVVTAAEPAPDLARVRDQIHDADAKVAAADAAVSRLNAAAPAAPPGPIAQKTLIYPAATTAVPGNASDDIAAFARQMQNNPDAKIVLSSYADANGTTNSTARRVSLQRAVQVRDEFNKLGVPAARVAVNAQTAEPGTENPDRVDITIAQ